MYWLDWILVIIPLIVVFWIALKSQKYVKGVSDFLTAGRVAGRYVVAVAGGEAGLGLISVVAIVEMYYSCGFAVSFWSRISGPLGLIFALTGYCAYRFRETRAMTLGQFFEIRYSRSFRVFTAILQSLSGIINYAIFPAVGARFLIYFLDLPHYINLFGWPFPTFGLVMACFLGIALLIIILGGQITIMVTDCVQGILSYPMYVIVVFYFLYRFSWSSEMVPVLMNRPDGGSFLNPYDIEKLRDFNLFYVLVGVFGTILNRLSWSGSQGYNAAAATPHEQKMGGLLGSWRSGFSVMMYVLMAIAALTYLNHPNFANEAKKVRTQLASKTLEDVAPGAASKTVRQQLEVKYQQIPAEDSLKVGNNDPETIALLKKRTTGHAVVFPSDPNEAIAQDAPYKKVTADTLKDVPGGKAKIQTFNTIYGQMLVPVAMREMLPMGITGIFCAIMIFLLISTDTTYMHSWGSILVQDLILPLRKKPFTPHQQLMLLRICITGVCIFAFLFSFFFAQVDYILMFFAITGAIWLGGAGPCIVFGLYWKRGTTAGAYCALLSGSLLAVGGIIVQNTWAGHIYPILERLEMVESVGWFLETVSTPFSPYIVWKMSATKFPINSQEIYFLTMLISVTLYIVISLLTCRKSFNMDRMLHRGIYSIDGKPVEKTCWSLKTIGTKILGIDAQYTLGDKILAWSVFIYSFVYGFLILFVAVVIWNIFQPWPNEWWAHYFYWTSIIIAAIVGIISTVWFTIGGTLDLMKLFRDLKNKEENTLDDGRVVGNVSAADLSLVEKVEEKEEEKDTKI